MLVSQHSFPRSARPDSRRREFFPERFPNVFPRANAQGIGSWCQVECSRESVGTFGRNGPRQQQQQQQQQVRGGRQLAGFREFHFEERSLVRRSKLRKTLNLGLTRWTKLRCVGARPRPWKSGSRCIQVVKRSSKYRRRGVLANRFPPLEDKQAVTRLC